MQFFHSAKEYEQWMPIELNKAELRVARPEDSAGSKQDAQKLLIELKVSNLHLLRNSVNPLLWHPFNLVNVT